MIFKRSKTWRESDYLKRQLSILSNLGLFYLILIAMFAIPLVGTFVIVLIKGVVDYRHLILLSGLIGALAIGYWMIRFFRGWLQKVKEDGGNSLREMHRMLPAGENVRLNVLGGLLSLSIGRQGSQALGISEGSSTLSLPNRTGDDGESVMADPVGQIKALYAMCQEGIIDEGEFEALKKAVIQRATSGCQTNDDMDRFPHRSPDSRCPVSWIS